MRVICIQDGECAEDSNFPTPKKGTIYHILGEGCPILTSVYRNEQWYRLIEMDGSHWHGLFLPVEYDDKLEKEIKLELHEK